MVADYTTKCNNACSALNHSVKWHVIRNQSTKISQRWQELFHFRKGLKNEDYSLLSKQSLLRNKGNCYGDFCSTHLNDRGTCSVQSIHCVCSPNSEVNI